MSAAADRPSAGCQVTGFDVVDEIDRSILGDILPPIRAGSQPGTAVGHGEKCAAVHITVDVGGVPPDVQRHDGAVRRYRYDLDVIVLHEWIFKHLCNVLFLHKEPLLFDCGTTLYGMSWTVFIIIVNYYTAGVQYASTTYREVTGLFKVGKYRPLIAAMINLAVSIILAYPLGISGILLGTIISRLCVYFWYDLYIIHKTMFGQKLRYYFATYLLYGLCTLAVGTLCFAIARSITLKNPILAFAIEMGICALLPNIFFFILFKRRAEFQIILGYMKRISRKIASRS